MPKVQVFDQQGNSIAMEYIDGVFLPRSRLIDDLQIHLDCIRDLELKDDDVMICAYPKCGTHWVWEMIQMLRAGEAKYDTRAKEALMIDFMPKHVLDALPSPRTLNTHFFFRHLPKQIVQKKTKIIVINRDPRDVAVSWFNHFKDLREEMSYSGDFKGFLPLFLQGTVAFGSWFEYTKDWEKVGANNPDLQVLSLYYEEMKKDSVKTVKQLSTFLGVEASDELCAAIADACDFGKLKAADKREKKDPLKEEWRKDGAGIYRKGRTGDWKNWFTVAQSEQMDAFYTRTMEDTKIFSRYVQGTS